MKKHRKKLGHSNLTMITKNTQEMIEEKKHKNYKIVAKINLPEYL